MNARERIQQYLNYKGITDYKLEREISASNAYWKKAKNPSSEVLEKIFYAFQDLSIEWVFRGTGSMLLTDQQPQSREGLIRMYQDLLEVRDNKIRELEMQLINLESQKMSV